jgi:hypothetical protein
MGLTYEQNKKHIQKWREANMDKVREYERNYKRENYKPTLMYKWETEARRLRNIKI